MSDKPSVARVSLHFVFQAGLVTDAAWDQHGRLPVSMIPCYTLTFVLQVDSRALLDRIAASLYRLRSDQVDLPSSSSLPYSPQALSGGPSRCLSASNEHGTDMVCRKSDEVMQ